MSQPLFNSSQLNICSCFPSAENKIESARIIIHPFSLKYETNSSATSVCDLYISTRQNRRESEAATHGSVRIIQNTVQGIMRLITPKTLKEEEKGPPSLPLLKPNSLAQSQRRIPERSSPLPVTDNTRIRRGTTISAEPADIAKRTAHAFIRGAAKIPQFRLYARQILPPIGQDRQSIPEHAAEKAYCRTSQPLPNTRKINEKPTAQAAIAIAGSSSMPRQIEASIRRRIHPLVPPISDQPLDSLPSIQQIQRRK